ncbi:sphinganine kinase lcb4 [Tulasnella sp. 425]|nr:sphinganine kinase lcb4 [Tulasnella sp. 425]
MASTKIQRASSISTLRRTFLKNKPPPMPTVAAAPQWHSLSISMDGKNAVVRFSDEFLEVHRKAAEALEPPTLQTSIKNVLYAEIKDGKLSLSTLARKKQHLHLVTLEAVIESPTPEDTDSEAEWVRALLRAAYGEAPPRRSFMIFVNPASGQGKGRAIFDKRLKPILEAAHCSFDVVYTTHGGHAGEMCLTLPLTYDAIITVSGDGTPYEVINGFAKRLDARAAFEKVAVVPIPAGSGNAFSLNLLGLVDGFDPIASLLNAIKGTPMHLDLSSVTMLKSRETVYSFLAQSGGLMAELDLGTEHLRWMGDSRFIVGFLKGVITNTPRQLRVLIKEPETDKPKLLDEFLAGPAPSVVAPDVTPGAEAQQRMPLPKHIDEPEGTEGWIEFDKPILYTYGGLMPYVARDLMDFPIKQPCDGFIHLVVQEIETRGTMIKMIDGGPKGEPFYLNTHRYHKTRAYRIIPTGPASKDRECFSIDGERIPYEGFHVEVHPGLLRTFSMNGKFMVPETFGKDGIKFHGGD